MGHCFLEFDLNSYQGLIKTEDNQIICLEGLSGLNFDGILVQSIKMWGLAFQKDL
jgi:hypothetical protein